MNKPTTAPIFMTSWEDEKKIMEGFVKTLRDKYEEALKPEAKKLLEDLETISKKTPVEFLAKAACVKEAEEILKKIQVLISEGNLINEFPDFDLDDHETLTYTQVSTYLKTEKVSTTHSDSTKHGQPLESLLASGSLETDIAQCEEKYKEAYDDPNFKIDRNKLKWKRKDVQTLKESLEKGLLDKVVVKAYPNMAKIDEIATANSLDPNTMTRERFLFHTLWNKFKEKGGKIWSGCEANLDSRPEVSHEDFCGEYTPKVPATGTSPEIPAQFTQDANKPFVLKMKDNSEEEKERMKEIVKLVYEQKVANGEIKRVKDFADTSELIFVNSDKNPARREEMIRNGKIQTVSETEKNDNKTYSFIKQMENGDDLLSNEEAMILLTMFSEIDPNNTDDASNYYLRSTWTNTRNITEQGSACYVDSDADELTLLHNGPARTDDKSLCVGRL